MISRFWPPALAFILGLAALELASALQLVNATLVPAPQAVLHGLLENRAEFEAGFLQTFAATALGFLSAGVAGFSLAFVFSLVPWLRRAVLPFAIFFQTVPIIAIAPLLVIYFGFGLTTVVVASAIVAIFPVLANTLLGLQSTDPGYIELLRVYGASNWQVFWQVRLPAAYPAVYAGLKIAAGWSVIGTVAGEFVAGGGLGAIIDSARTQQRTDLVFGALVLLSLLGLLLIAGVRFINWLVNLYRPYGLMLGD